MSWLFAFGWLPVPVIYVGWLPFKAEGFTPLVLVLIVHARRGDRGLHQHELEHAEQAWRGLLLVHALLYLLWPRYRLRAELAAYRRQIRYLRAAGSAVNVGFFARRLVTHYRLRITEDQARELLTAE